MKSAVYAGSFDPWSFGHQFILDSALGVFDQVHVLAAVNPAKPGTLDPTTRARIIAHAIDPFTDWWRKEPPFEIHESVVVSATTGLVAHYAADNDITHLIRGLRSTSDFEAEFNLYFANHAILPGVQTWAIMCPPELLHCSSTYVKTVIGTPDVNFVGTCFVAQAVMLKTSRALGEIFDLIQLCSTFRFAGGVSNLGESDINAALQRTFTSLALSEKKVFGPQADAKLRTLFQAFLKKRQARLGDELSEGEYPEELVNELWAILASVAGTSLKGTAMAIAVLEQLGGNLGRTAIPLFDKKNVAALLKPSAGPAKKGKSK